MNGPNSIAQSHSTSFTEPAIQHMTKITSAVYHLERRTQTFRVVSGFAWVSMDDQDFTMAQGEELQITRGKYPVVIQAMRHQPLTFTVY
jgi:5-keto 4-deoxyuronate isomerase